MKERNGVRVGQRVQDLDGRRLGRVTELFEWGFGVEKGFPILFRQDHVFRYDDVRGTRDGALVVARTARDLTELSGGEMPRSWRIPAPPGVPRVATPPEARAVFAEIAAARLAAPLEPLEPVSGPAPVESLIWEPSADKGGAAEEHRHAERRGQGAEARTH